MHNRSRLRPPTRDRALSALINDYQNTISKTARIVTLIPNSPWYQSEKTTVPHPIPKSWTPNSDNVFST